MGLRNRCKKQKKMGRFYFLGMKKEIIRTVPFLSVVKMTPKILKELERMRAEMYPLRVVA